jgi:hypothetical protein
MNGKALSIKNDSKINYLAKEISEYIHRGSATTEKLSATLHLIKEETGLKTLKNLEQSQIEGIVSGSKAKAEAGGISLSNANSHISSINNIIKYLGREDLHVIKASDYGLSRKINEKDGINKENSREFAAAFKTWLNEKYLQTKDLRYAALKHAVNIQSVNLRLRESLLVKLGKKDLSNNILKIAAKGDGSKNSRAREIKINSEQKATLLEARQFLKNNNLKNLNIGTVRNGRDFANNTLKAFKNETGVYFHFHGERHFQAHEAYKSAWQGKGYVIECRARTGETKTEWRERILSETGLSKSEFAILDKEIRQEISRDLGHERIEITSRYIG